MYYGNYFTIQLSLEQCGVELHGSAYMWILVSWPTQVKGQLAVRKLHMRRVLYVDFWLCRWWVSLTPHCSRVTCTCKPLCYTPWTCTVMYVNYFLIKLEKNSGDFTWQSHSAETITINNLLCILLDLFLHMFMDILKIYEEVTLYRV